MCRFSAVLGLVAAILPSLVAAKCPSPKWVHKIGTSDCFYLSTIAPKAGGGRDDVTPEDASDKCNALHGSLSSVKGEAELGFLKSEMEKIGVEAIFWTGLMYTEVVTAAPYKFIWTDSRRPFAVGDLGGSYNPLEDENFAALRSEGSIFVGVEYKKGTPLAPFLANAAGKASFMCRAGASN